MILVVSVFTPKRPTRKAVKCLHLKYPNFLFQMMLESLVGRCTVLFMISICVAVAIQMSENEQTKSNYAVRSSKNEVKYSSKLFPCDLVVNFKSSSTVLTAVKFKTLFFLRCPATMPNYKDQKGYYSKNQLNQVLSV